MTFLLSRTVALLFLFAGSLRAADILAAIRRADDERVAATLAGNLKALGAIYSDEVYYAHSSGKLDTKASQLEGIANGTYKYTRFDYQDRTFRAIAPGIVLMKGKAVAGLTRPSGEKILLLDLLTGSLATGAGKVEIPGLAGREEHTGDGRPLGGRKGVTRSPAFEQKATKGTKSLFASAPFVSFVPFCKMDWGSSLVAAVIANASVGWLASLVAAKLRDDEA